METSAENFTGILMNLQRCYGNTYPPVVKHRLTRSLKHAGRQRKRDMGGGNFFWATSRSNNLFRKSVKDHTEKLILSPAVRFEQEPKSKAWTSVEKQPLALMQEMQGETRLYYSIVNTEYLGPAKPVQLVTSLNIQLYVFWQVTIMNN